MRSPVVSLAIAASIGGLLGCSSFDRLDFQYKSAPPDNAIVTYDAIRMHEGIAVGVVARPMDGNDVMSDDTRVELQSQNPGVIGVGQGVADDPNDTSQANWNFVFYGVGVGSAQIIVRVDGSQQTEIPVTVEAQ
jgi:hypothetical protein